MKFFTSLLFILFITWASVYAQEKKTYTVQQGETLYSISKTLDVSVAELQSWNDLTDNALSIGDELVYYTVEQEQEAETAIGESLVSISTPPENIFYTVKSGDNLTVIARAHNMTVQELRALNDLSSDILSIGQQLSVRKMKDSVGPSVSEFSEESSPQGTFVVFTVEQNQTLSDILRKFKMSEKELQELNPEVNLSSITQNQKITVLLPPSKSYSNPYLNSASLQDLGEVGVSSYKTSELGNTTVNGELYNPDELTAAHSNIALGTIIFIENSKTKAGIYVRINDRITDSGLKLSGKAFRILGLNDLSNPTVTIYTES